MSKQTTPPLECSGPCHQQDQNPAARRQSTDIGIVLEEAIEERRFQDGGCAVLCPGCGTSVKRYYEGLPDPFVRFASDCPECGVSLRRWAVVVTPGIRATAPSTNDLQRVVQSYWDRQFRVGVVDDQLPHTREFSDLTQNLAAKWNWDWEVTCPLCDRPVSQLNEDYLGYHHWIYETDTGTSLCHDCHNFLHGGGNSNQANRQDWRAKELGLADFRDLAVIRLALRDRAVHDPELKEDDPGYAERLRRRYNVPVAPGRITTLVADVRHQDAIANTLQARGPSPKINVRSVSSL